MQFGGPIFLPVPGVELLAPSALSLLVSVAKRCMAKELG